MQSFIAVQYLATSLPTRRQRYILGSHPSLTSPNPLMNCFNHSLIAELSATATARTFNNEQTSMSDFLSSCHRAEEEAVLALKITDVVCAQNFFRRNRTKPIL